MDNTRQIREYLAALEHMKKFFNRLLEEEKATLSGPASEREKIAELTELRMLAKSDLWPAAVPKELISDTETQNARAMGILQTMDVSLSGKKFLDFGCGDGYTVGVAKEVFGANSFGYDIKNYGWDNANITDNLEIVAKNGPYDVILLFDVLDHSSNPEDILKECKLLLSGNGKIFVRVHPWFSRSGTHIYKELNKAYLQLVFDNAELATLGVTQENVNKITSPEVYKNWIKSAELTIASEKTIRQNIELFFTHNPAILRRIKSNFANEFPDFPRNMLEIQFIDLTLI
jgi:2-polyprenyl-3-methyl-5-hydroxy-6-metoxy-1,4-benzoquinol methylase